jgi:drug/metabolite transporter (DMT)-like permease
LFILLGGGASLAIRFTYGELPPFWAATLRFTGGAIIFWILVLVRKVQLPRGRALLGTLLFGALSVGISFSLVYWSLVKTPASLFQMTIAIVPLLTLMFASLHGLEKFHLRSLLGALMAVVGIAIAFGGSLSAGVSLSLPHLLAVILAAACFAESGVIVKMIPRTHPFAINAIAMTVGSLILATGSLVAGEEWVLPSSPGVWLAMAYLIIGASLGTFSLYLFVLGRWTASGTSYGFLLAPIVTAVLAATLVGETITWVFVAGGALVLFGVWVGAFLPSRSRKLPTQMSEEPETDTTHTGSTDG